MQRLQPVDHPVKDVIGRSDVAAEPPPMKIADGHNLPWKRPNLSAPNTTYNLNSVTSWARFTGVLGDFSNFGTGQANVQASIRAEF